MVPNIYVGLVWVALDTSYHARVEQNFVDKIQSIIFEEVIFLIKSITAF